MNYDEAKPGFVDSEKLDGGRYTIECRRGDLPDDLYGRMHWDVVINGQHFQHGFWMRLERVGDRPVDVALGHVSKQSDGRILKYGPAPTKSMEEDVRRFQRAARKFVKNTRGAIKDDWALVAIGMGIVLAVRLAVGVWG